MLPPSPPLLFSGCTEIPEGIWGGMGGFPGPGWWLDTQSSLLSLPGNSPNEQVEQTAPLEAKVFSQIRHLALIQRGIQFLEMQQDKKALMDFQHSLHVRPGTLGGGEKSPALLPVPISNSREAGNKYSSQEVG